ncbi:response regulator [Chlorogloeopsis sp. ULAP01]|uniref:response regulator n=1 Tax=Chlorogloeopsis sp. ULAP01 TaxID=3056483 RepID=UPI0025AB053C|nr:response regulator [Chlorogloeopsis sp. ULAP01]MDM9381362.1 response regulator [Chlorogloeopsis sp. ULAP01]
MSRKQILLIDSEASVREVLQVCLRDLGGWDVFSVFSWQEGLKVLMKKQPDAILLDVPTLDVDNLSILQQFRDHPLTQSIPILLLSTRASWFPPFLLQEMGIAGAIALPFNPTLLPEQVAKLLNWTSDSG